MPLQVPLIDTFAPLREGISGLQNALFLSNALKRQSTQDEMRRQEFSQTSRINALKLVQGEQEEREKEELRQLLSSLPQEDRARAAMNFYESKGQFENARHVRAIHEELNPVLTGVRESLKVTPDLAAALGLSPDSVGREYQASYIVDPKGNKKIVGLEPLAPTVRRLGDIVTSSITGEPIGKQPPGRPVEVSPSASLAQPDEGGGYKTVYTAPGKSEPAKTDIELFQRDPGKARAFMEMGAIIRSKYRLDRNPSVAEFMTDLYRKDPATFNAVFKGSIGEKAEDRKLRVLQLAKDPITGEINQDMVGQINKLLQVGPLATDETISLPSRGDTSAKPTQAPAATGPDLSALPQPTPSGRVRVLSPDGKRGTIPLSQLPDAKRKGYRVIQ